MSRPICAATVQKFYLGNARWISTGKIRREAPADAVGVDGLKSFEEIPEAKGLPFIGTLLDYTPMRGFKVRRIFELWEKRHKQFGDIYRERIGGVWYVYCNTREHTGAMYRQESRFPLRQTVPSIAFFKKAAGLPDSFINVSGEVWYRQRKILNEPLLFNKMVWKYVGSQMEVAEDLTAYIRRNMDEKGEVADFATVLDRWAFEMSSVFLLDCRMGLLDDLPNPLYMEIFGGLERMMNFLVKSFEGLKLWRFIPTKESRELNVAVKRSYEIMSGIVEQKQQSGELDDTVLGKILKSETVTQLERLSLVYDVLGASVETTSKSSALMLYCLTLNKDVQENLRQEIKDLPPNDQLTGRILDGMKYLNAFIKEAIRLYPLTHSHNRIYDKDIVLSGYDIPAGTPITNTSNSTRNRDADYFPDPDKFLPERWMQKPKPNKNNLTGPFGIGARACPGRRFAMQEMRLLLIELLRNFEVEYHYKPMESLFRGTGYPSEEPKFAFKDINRDR